MIKVYLFNEWKESANYMFAKWFNTKKLSIEQWFNSDDYTGLEFDYFEYDTSNNGPIYLGTLDFNEKTIQYKLFFVIDANTLTADDTIEEVDLRLDGYNKNTGELIGSLERNVTEGEIVPDLLIELINEFKIEYVEDENSEEQTNIEKPETETPVEEPEKETEE